MCRVGPWEGMRALWGGDGNMGIRFVILCWGRVEVVTQDEIPEFAGLIYMCRSLGLKMCWGKMVRGVFGVRKCYVNF